MQTVGARSTVDDIVARLERLPTSSWQVKARIPNNPAIMRRRTRLTLGALVAVIHGLLGDGSAIVK